MKKKTNNILRHIISELLIITFLICSLNLTSYAATSKTEVENLGFILPDGYTYEGLKKLPSLKVYANDPAFYEDNILIGTCDTTVVFATKKIALGTYSHIALIKSSMFPEISIAHDRFGGYKVYGINCKNEVKMKIVDRVILKPKYTKYLSSSNYTDLFGWFYTTLDYNKIIPSSENNMPEASATWNVSAGLSCDDGGKVGFNIGTGYSTSTKKNCLDYQSNYYKSSNQFDVSYKYNIDMATMNDAERAMNRWCIQQHTCYYAYAFVENRPTDKLALLFGYNASTWFADFDITATFKYAKIAGGVDWNGGAMYIQTPENSASSNSIFKYHSVGTLKQPKIDAGFVK